MSRTYLDAAHISVTPRKQTRVSAAAEVWMSKHTHEFDECRFDVIGITLSEGGGAEIEHIEDAFASDWAF